MSTDDDTDFSRNPQPSADQFVAQIGVAIDAIISREPDLVEDARKALTRVLAATKPKTRVTRRQAAAIYWRDRFICRYCGARTIPTPIMRLLSNRFPEDFPLHPNWKTSATHPAVIARSSSIDHVSALTSGGDPLSPGNLVTACWPCNLRKSGFELSVMGWNLRPQPTSHETWDGVVGQYRELLAAVREAVPLTESEIRFHGDWLAAFEAARPS